MAVHEHDYKWENSILWAPYDGPPSGKCIEKPEYVWGKP